VKVGIVEYFDGMHFIPASKDKRCSKAHGHTYKVEVAVEGKLKGGMVIDFIRLRKVVKEVLKKYDHANLNKFISCPTAENISLRLQKELQKRLKMRVSVRVWEGEGKWAQAGD
jgi:6-pyruvoyltetrahydropterin/6-carboxytetrahydropterin synthase